MTRDTTLAEYIYNHMKRCLGGSEERRMNEKIINKKGGQRRKTGREGRGVDQRKV